MRFGEPRFADFQLILDALALGDVLDHGDANAGMLNIFADQRNRQATPQHAAIFADKAFFHLKTGNFASEKAIEFSFVLGNIVRMGKD